jgi:hypothetical protein
MGHLATYIKGDYELAQQWYGASGKYHECFMYPSNLYQEYNIKQKKHTTINILVGNSADPTNNHLKIFDKLVKYKDEDISIYVPLSYGNQEHAKEVISKGKTMFGDKFIPLTELMPFEKYFEFLGEVDIAIFAHKRQQAFGNTVTLLGLDKKVFLDSSTVQWDFFNKHDIKVFDIKSISLENIKTVNKEKIKNIFSKENLIIHIEKIFSE